MKPLLALLLLPCMAVAEDIKTLDGKTYTNATVARVEIDGIVVDYADGAGKLYFTNLPDELQKKYGYDPVKVEAVRAAAAARDQARREWKEKEALSEYLHLKIKQVLPDGLTCYVTEVAVPWRNPDSPDGSGPSRRWADADETIFLKKGPTDLVDEDTFYCRANKTGIYRFKDTTGARCTIEEWTYLEPSFREDGLEIVQKKKPVYQ